VQVAGERLLFGRARAVARLAHELLVTSFVDDVLPGQAF
jgi:hypothetical protein